jgi:hypothetical protein
MLKAISSINSASSCERMAENCVCAGCLRIFAFVCGYIRERCRLKFTTHKSLSQRRLIYLLDNLRLSARKIKMHASQRKREDYFSRVICGVTSRAVNFKCKYVASKLMRRAKSQTIFGLFPLVLSLHCFCVR